ncbi:hypothetical protein BDBG_16617, partial [Blastomyces gilchristii SLH14081]
ALALEIILIKDVNTAETTLFHSQASFIVFSFNVFSADKIMCISDYKHLSLSDFCCYSSNSVSSSFISFTSVLSALTSGSAGLMLFFNFSTHI